MADAKVIPFDDDRSRSGGVPRAARRMALGARHGVRQRPARAAGARGATGGAGGGCGGF